MSVGSVGLAGNVALGQLQQARSADADRAAMDTSERQGHSANTQAAEAAEGIGRTQPEEAAGDRDADGRRLWERSGKQRERGADEPSPPWEAHLAPDPEGQAGQTVDLTG